MQQQQRIRIAAWWSADVKRGNNRNAVCFRAALGKEKEGWFVFIASVLSSWHWHHTWGCLRV